jgi:pilus assembly protein CpaF
MALFAPQPASSGASRAAPPATPPAREPTAPPADARAPAPRPAVIVSQKADVDVVQSLVMDRVDAQLASRLSPDALAKEIERLVDAIIAERKLPVDAPERDAIVRNLLADVIGFGPLEPLLADESISDILVDGAKRVYVERFGKLEPTEVMFRDESAPLVDARLPDGSRVNVIIPPLAIDGPTISIRKFTKRAVTLAMMVEQGNISQAIATLLTIAVKSRLNILVSGGTGSGKTTLLNALSQMIDPNERIVTIEDAAELQLQQERVVRLETRTANLEGRGAIAIRDLFRNALRMRPDRIIVGEIRGSESMDMLQAMNSGHDGSLGTIHASGPREALTRLENLLDMSGINLPMRAARHQIATALDMIVQVSRMADGKRRVTSVMEVLGMEEDIFVTQELFAFKYAQDTREGRVRGSFTSRRAQPHFMPKAENFGLGAELMRAMNGG